MANGTGTCSCETENWCDRNGPVPVQVDSAGCPLSERYCKIQAGGTALAIAAGAAFTITITITNLVSARVRGMTMEAAGTAGPIAAQVSPSLLNYIGVNSILILGTQMLSGEVHATRWARDATGPGGVGTRQWYPGDLGTAGGLAVIVGINRSVVEVNIWAAIDIDGMK